MAICVRGQYPPRIERRPRTAVLVVILVIFLMAAIEGWSLDAITAVIAAVAAASVPAVATMRRAVRGPLSD
jgi:uncharacterized protein (DUF2342 family)